MATYMSGAVLASLIYDQKKNHGDQEGLLLGEVVNRVRDIISDSQMSNSQLETKIYIYSCVPCLRSQRFYDGSCHVIPSQLDSLLGDRKKDIVGWYRFRHNSSMRLSMREKAVHQNLSRFCRENEATSNNFLFMLCTGGLSNNWSTHNLDFVCHRQSANNVYGVVPVTVINLGDTTHDEYRAESCHTVPQRGVFSSMMGHFEKEFVDKSGNVEEVGKVLKMGESFSLHLQELQQHMTESERQLALLEEDVKSIRDKVIQKRNKELASQALLQLEQPPSYMDKSREGKVEVFKKQSSIDNMEERIQRARTARRLSSGRSLHLSSSDQGDEEETDRKQQKSPVEHKIDLIDFSTDELPDVSGESVHNAKTDRQQSNSDHMTSTDQLHTVTEHDDDSLDLIPPSDSEKKNGAEVSSKKTGDKFDFVSNLLEEAKSGHNHHAIDGESSPTMTLPVGNKIQLPVNGAEMTKGGKSSGVSVKPIELTPHTRLRSNRQNAAAVAAATSLGNTSKNERTRGQRTRTKQGQTSSKAEDSKETDITQDGKFKTVPKCLNQNSEISGNAEICLSKKDNVEEIYDVDFPDCNRQTSSPLIFS